MECPYCGELLNEVWVDNIQGRRFYYECFSCGYCSEEYESGFDFSDPDSEVDSRIPGNN